MEKSTTSRPWLIGGGVVSLLITLITWTWLRRFLVITDGAPEATDPFTPFGVSLVNAVLVLVGWLAWTVLFFFWRGVAAAVASWRSSRPSAGPR